MGGLGAFFCHHRHDENVSVADDGGCVAAGMSYQVGYGYIRSESAGENAGNPRLEQRRKAHHGG